MTWCMTSCTGPGRTPWYAAALSAPMPSTAAEAAAAAPARVRQVGGRSAMTLTPAGVVPAGVATGRVRAGEAAGEAEAAAARPFLAWRGAGAGWRKTER